MCVFCSLECIYPARPFDLFPVCHVLYPAARWIVVLSFDPVIVLISPPFHDSLLCLLFREQRGAAGGPEADAEVPPAAMLAAGGARGLDSHAVGEKTPSTTLRIKSRFLLRGGGVKCLKIVIVYT